MLLLLQANASSVERAIALSALLHRVDEIGENFLLIHRNLLEMLAHNLSELGLIEARPRAHFEELLVATKRLHLQRVELDFDGTLVVGFTFIAARSRAFRSRRLDLELVSVTDELRAGLKTFFFYVEEKKNIIFIFCNRL